tara:strand:+ start:288 stop:1142 length:855 start_codon:yes stop_codon:yes gene_type:complete
MKSDDVRFTLACLFLLLVTGPWMRTILVQVFSIDRLVSETSTKMLRYLASRIGPSLAQGFYYFLIPPFFFLLTRRLFPASSEKMQHALMYAGAAVSIGAMPVLWIVPERDQPNSLGQVLVVDFVLMEVWHCVLIWHQTVPFATLFGGPLLGLCYDLERDDGRDARISSGILVSLVFLYASVPSLYDAFQTSSAHDRLSTVSANEWYGYEMYALISVAGGFLVICSGLRWPCLAALGRARFAGQWVETLAYVLLLNANVAAAWAAKQGVLRSLHVPRIFGWTAKL